MTNTEWYEDGVQMEPKLVQYDNVAEAIRGINTLIQAAKERGINVLGADVRQHLYPGDVYDAYEAIGRKASVENELHEDACGPLAAVFLHRCPNADPATWRTYVERSFDPEYAAGFMAGFRLTVPAEAQDGQTVYLRGVYEGVMAHAAVF